MKSPSTGAAVTIWECPDPADTAEAAIAEAKAVIDAAGLNFASEEGSS
jgi:hypothetical protein